MYSTMLTKLMITTRITSWASFGGSPAASLAPPHPLKLGDGAGMEEGFHLTAAALEEENSWSLMT